MVQGIQITATDNPALLNSIWLIDAEAGQARCLAAAEKYEADQIVPLAELGQYESRELNIQAPPAREGGQHLNVNVLKRETLQKVMEARERIEAGNASNDDHAVLNENAQLTIRVGW